MRNDILRPVPVMGVKVPDGNALDTAVERGKRGDGYVAEIAETHRVVARSVMSRRPHEAKGALPVDAGERGLDRGAGGQDRMVEDPWVSRRINIKIAHCGSYLLHVIARMGAQQITLLRRLRFAPNPFGMSIFQYRNGARDSFRPLRMAGV